MEFTKLESEETSASRAGRPLWLSPCVEKWTQGSQAGQTPGTACVAWVPLHASGGPQGLTRLSEPPLLLRS